MKIPIEVGKLTKATIAAKKTYAKPPIAFQVAFRVSQEEHDEFFAVPKMDEKAEIIFKLIQTSKKIGSYSRFWEAELTTMDRFMRSMTRLSAFQLSILNATMVELQPVQDQQPSNEDFAIPATDLATDMAGQMMKLSIGFSHRLTRLRRENACAGIKAKVIDMLRDDLLELPYDHDPTLLCGGQYDKTSRKAAKKEEAARATRRSSQQRIQRISRIQATLQG
jgi:hypothetical protein